MLVNSDTYFYKVESGSIIINLPKLIDILNALEVSTEEFFYNDIENYKNDKETIELKKHLSKE